MPVLASSTLPSLGAPRAGWRMRAGDGPGEVVEVAQYDLIEPCKLVQQVRVAPKRDRERDHLVCGYRVGQLVGRGGMSVVFEVTHPKFREPLAMKVITDRRLQDQLAADAIFTHAQAIGALSSPHVVRTVDAGRLPSGEPFVVMERLDGDDLAKRLEDSGPLPFADAIRFVIEACNGLAEAHAAGIVHGDIKPGNLVIAATGAGTRELKIVDFAPSVPRASDPTDPLVTCSAGYASPEQLGARRDVDGRADVWALGAVLYELVTGRRAFEAATLADMLKVIGRVPTSIKSMRPDVPVGLEIVVRRCLARDREARYSDILALRNALVALETTHANDVSFARHARESARRATVSGAKGSARVDGSLRVPRRRAASRIGRFAFLAALGPLSTLVSMTLVRFVMASGLVAAVPPPKWPAPARLAPVAPLVQAGPPAPTPPAMAPKPRLASVAAR